VVRRVADAHRRRRDRHAHEAVRVEVVEVLHDGILAHAEYGMINHIWSCTNCRSSTGSPWKSSCMTSCAIASGSATWCFTKIIKKRPKPRRRLTAPAPPTG